MVGKYKTVEFWAENGKVKILDKQAADKNEENYVTEVDPDEFYKRVLAVCVLNKDVNSYENYLNDSLVEQAREIYRIAKTQAANMPRLITPAVSSGHKIIANYRFKQKPPEEILKTGYELEVV